MTLTEVDVSELKTTNREYELDEHGNISPKYNIGEFVYVCHKDAGINHKISDRSMTIEITLVRIREIKITEKSIQYRCTENLSKFILEERIFNRSELDEVIKKTIDSLILQD